MFVVLLLLVVEVMVALGTLKVAVTEGTALSLLLSLANVGVASLLLLEVVVILLLSLGVVIV